MPTAEDHATLDTMLIQVQDIEIDIDTLHVRIDRIEDKIDELIENQSDEYRMWITQEGDTVSVPINQIKPAERYHVIGYNYYRPHAYGPFYRFGWAVRPYEQVTYPHWTQDFYNNNNLHYNSGNGTNINYNPYGFGNNTPSVNSNPVISTPPNPPNPAKTNMKKIN